MGAEVRMEASPRIARLWRERQWFLDRGSEQIGGRGDVQSNNIKLEVLEAA